MPETPQHIYGQYINGTEVLEGATILDRRNPANLNDVVARSYDGTHALATAAVESASKAFERWSEVPASGRARVLTNAMRLLMTPEWQARFVKAMVDEIGKTTAGAVGEVGKTIAILEYMLGLPKHATGRRVNSDRVDVEMYERYEPAGVAALITPFNFPLAVTVWKLAAALAAGCTAVVKPSPAAPITSALIIDLFQEAMKQVPGLKDIWPGVINLVHGGEEVVLTLIRNKLVQAISFTGSTPVGRKILIEAITRPGWPIDPKHIVCEMGGCNTMLVLASAKLDMAVSAAVTGVAVGEGQRCTATKDIIVDETVAEKFTQKFIAEISNLNIGPGIDPANDVGPLESLEALHAVMAAIEECRNRGMKVICGGKRLTDGVLAQGCFIAPTVLEGILKKEIFGPVAGLSMVRGLEAGITVVNDRGHRHVAVVFTQDVDEAYRFIKQVKTGMRGVNDSTLGGDVQIGFGGAGGDTSFGPQEMGPEAMGIFQKRITVSNNHSGKVLGGRTR